MNEKNLAVVRQVLAGAAWREVIRLPDQPRPGCSASRPVRWSSAILSFARPEMLRWHWKRKIECKYVLIPPHRKRRWWWLPACRIHGLGLAAAGSSLQIW